MKKPKLISRKILTETPYFSIRQDKLSISGNVDGKKKKLEKDFYLLDSNDFVSVIVCNGDQILITKQYRYPINDVSVEFVAGICEDEDFEDCAKRELLEEAGLVARNLKFLGKIYPLVGKSNCCGHIFFCDDFEIVEKQMEDMEQLMGLDTQWVFVGDIKDMISSGMIKDSISISR
jgi:ADP-ribose pyrophosphatase